MEFEQVQMSFRDNDGQTWKGARPTTASSGPDTGKVELTGNVHVNGLLPGSTALLTSQPRNFPWTRTRTSSHRRARDGRRRPGDSSNPRDCVATLNEHHLVLESNVRGTFTP